MEIILGVIVSLIAQITKKKSGSREYTTLAIVLLLSLLSAIGYTLLVANGYWDSVYKILVTAGAFYVFIVKRFDK